MSAKNGNATVSDADLAAHLANPRVLPILLVHGDYQVSQEQVWVWLKQVGAEIPIDQVPRLYRLAVTAAREGAEAK